MLLPLLILAQVVSAGGAREYATAPEHSASAERYTLPAPETVPAEMASAVSAAAAGDLVTPEPQGSSLPPAGGGSPEPADWEALGLVVVLSGGAAWVLLRRRRSA